MRREGPAFGVVSSSMSFLLGGFFFGVVLPLVAIVVAVWAYSIARRRSPAPAPEERIAALEEQVRGLLYRVWTLERGAAERATPVAAAAPAVPATEAAGQAPEVRACVETVEVPHRGELVAAPASGVEPPAPIEAVTPPPPPVQPFIDLEQRIGARWATWVGIVAILFAASLFLKWSFDSDLLKPEARVVLSLAAGLILLFAGLALHRRRDVPYLSEGLAGLGLGVLYLSLWAAHALYALLGPGAAFAGMLGVTVLGALVSLLSSRQITAVLTVLGGLLTPILLKVASPDERNLLVYLIALDFLVLAIARFRSWPSLNRLAWAGSALLFAPAFLRQPDAPNPLSRLVLLSGLFLLFLAVPLLRERTEYRRIGEIDLVVVVGNAAGYFWVVWATLESWHPGAEGPYALALAIVYRAAAADYAARVPGDQATVVLHEGISWTFLTIAIPLALDGPWVTLAWAIQGLTLLWVARRALTPVAAWGGFAALLLASIRVAGLDRYWYPDSTPVWNLTYLVHLLVVIALAAGGGLARVIRSDRAHSLTGPRLASALWLVGALVLALLFWREPSGLWPASFLTAEVLVLGALARVSASLAFAAATPVVAAVLLARVFGADDLHARAAAFSLLSRPLLSRVAACAALGVAGGWLARSEASPRARVLGRLVSGTAGLALLFALSVNWTRYQDLAFDYARDAGRGEAAAEISWRTQVGLSVLWTLYAALALGWGFLRSAAAIRYGALALFGLTAFKVFLVDLSAVRTTYRILSFLTLGIVLLLVSLAYQKARKPAAPASVGPVEG